MDLDVYRELRAQARRLTRHAAEADDLVQDTLLVALEAGRRDPAWLSGVLRKRAAMAVRGLVRRRRREHTVADAEMATAEAPGVPDPAPDPEPLLRSLPPAARKVAVLALHGLSASEIRWILQLTPTAFRQRLTSIRKAIGQLPPQQQAESLALAYVRDPARSAELQFGLIRRALIAAMRGADALGTHDHDGHLLLIRPQAHDSEGGGNR